jgi:hypothetical protein
MVETMDRSLFKEVYPGVELNTSDFNVLWKE